MAKSNRKKRTNGASLRKERMDRAKRRVDKAPRQFSLPGLALRGAILISVFLIIYIILVNSSFKVETFDIEGNKVVSDEDVISLSGISVGDNLFQSDVNAAEKQIALHVMIDEVDVRVRPFHKILIQVTEKNAVAGFVKDGKYFYIDPGMVVVGETENVDAKLPLLSGFEIPSFVSIGMQLEDENIKNGIFIGNAALPLFKGYTLEVCPLSESENNIYLNGVEVHLGTTGQLEKKLTALKSLIGSMSEQKLQSLEYIDVTIADEPVVKERPVGETASETEGTDPFGDSETSSGEEGTDGTTTADTTPSAAE